MEPSPRFFNPYENVLRHGDRLPHWQQPGASYFVTFRLSDSIPQSQRKAWQEERELWLAQNPQPWSDEIEQRYHRIFSTRIDHDLDEGAGSCILSNPEAAKAFSETVLAANERRYRMHSFVVMPNHVHLAFTLSIDESLPALIKIWKGVSARRIGAIIDSPRPLWQRDYFDRIIRGEDHFSNVIHYIRRNPEKAHLRGRGFLLWESEPVQQSTLPHT